MILWPGRIAFEEMRKVRLRRDATRNSPRRDFEDFSCTSVQLSIRSGIRTFQFTNKFCLLLTMNQNVISAFQEVAVALPSRDHRTKNYRRPVFPEVRTPR